LPTTLPYFHSADLSLLLISYSNDMQMSSVDRLAPEKFSKIFFR
jgi:hypothetical protein